MKKALACLLALLMCVGVLAACGQGDDTQVTSGQGEVTASTEPVEESPYDANGYLKDSLDPTLNFNNKEITLLYWSDVEKPEFEVEELTGDLVKDAIYNRNMTVEQRLGVKLNWIGTPGNFGNQAAFITVIGNDVSAGGDYNLFCGYSLTGATIALRGYSRDLMDLDYLDFEKPWWPDSLLSQATYKDHLFFCSGDISTNMLHMMYCTVYNKTLAETANLPSFYDDVRNGTWTIDKMMEYSSGMYADLNGDGALTTAADQYGFMTCDLHFDALYTGAGLKTLDKDADGNLVISPDFASEKTQALLEKLVTYFKEDYCDITGTASTNTDVKAISQNRALFDISRAYIVSWDWVKDSDDFRYGMLPVPKFDEDQEDYVTCMAFPYTLYSMSYALSEDDANVTAAVLECMCSEGYRQVSPALFETTMKLKYASGQDDSDMYDTIRRTIYIDLGRIFATDLKNITYDPFRSVVKNKSTNWASICKGQSKVLSSLIASVSDTLEGRIQ